MTAEFEIEWPSIELMAVGGVEPMRFELGHSCGDVKQSVCFDQGRGGQVLTREQVVALRDFLIQCADRMGLPPYEGKPAASQTPSS